MPGIIPSFAYSRKQIRQSPKSRIKPCARPQRKQRFTARVLNLGVFFERAITDVFAIICFIFLRNIASLFLYHHYRSATERKRDFKGAQESYQKGKVSSIPLENAFAKRVLQSPWGDFSLTGSTFLIYYSYMPIATTVVFIIVLVILILAVIILLAIGVMLTYGSIASRVPLVPVRQRAVSFIVETLGLTDGSVLYDLGSGDGRVLEHALERTPRLKAIGLEIAPWPRLISKIKLKRFGKRAVIKNKNFFTADFSDATHVYLYLFPSVMDELKPMFDRTLAPGTRVVSCDFQFTNKEPDQILLVPHAKMLAKTLYVYTW